MIHRRYSLHLSPLHPQHDNFKDVFGSEGIPVTLPNAYQGYLLGVNIPAYIYVIDTSSLIRDQLNYFDEDNEIYYLVIHDDDYWVETIQTQTYNRLSRWFFWNMKRLGF